MLHGSASVVVLWRALTETGGASACRSSSDSDGSGRMARTWPLMLQKGAPVVVVVVWSVVVWYAGLVCHEAERSASLVVVVWSAGQRSRTCLLMRDKRASVVLVCLVSVGSARHMVVMKSAGLVGSASDVVLWRALAGLW